MWGRSVLLVSLALVALGTAKCPRRKTSPVREILCYTSISDAQILAGSVCSCTTLVHQNHDVRNVSISDISDLRKSLKEMHPSLQFAISIHDPAMTLRNSAMVRQEAIARIIAVMKEVDGVEMNVTAGSKERLYNFIKSLKDEMIRKSYDKRIFIALPTRSEDLAKQFDIKELIKYIDLFTLPTDYMTDEDGAFVTFHPSRLMGLFDMLNTDSLVDLISGLGAPKQKILMTLPASAYKFTLKNEDENAPRSETTEKEPVPIDRKQLCEAMNSGEWTVERDEDLTAPYAFQNKTWIAFEDKISVGIKGKYALLRDLAGLAVRNIENDVETECEEPLSQEIYHSFTEFRRKSRQAVLNALEDELHQMQFSYPNHAKTSSFRVVRVVDTEGHIRAVRESTQTEFVCRRQGYFVHPKSCNRFYRCVKFNQGIEDYSVFEFDCPAGLSFDERTEVCVWPGSLPEGSPCPGSSEIAPVAPKRFECSQPGYYADPQNCRWFFACMDLGGAELMAFEFRCPYGLVFDEKKLVCEWPWLVPACSESGSGYARTEYNYGGYTAGASTGDGAGGYVTSGLPEYSVTAGRDHSDVDYSRTTDTYGTNYFGSTAGNIGKPGISVPGDGGLSGSARVDYSKSDEYGGTVSSVPAYNNIQTGSVPPNTIVGEGGTGYSASSGRIGGGGYGVSTGQGGAGYSGGFNTGFAHTGSSGGVTAGFGNKGSSGGVTAGFENTGGFSGATTDTYGTNYFGSTAGNIGKPGISVPGGGGLSGSARVDYSKSDEYGGTVSSVPAYNNIQTGSVPPNTIVGEGGTGYSASSGRIGGGGYGVSTGQGGAGYSGGFNIGFAHTGSSGGVTAGFGNKGSSGGVTAGFENTGGFSGATAGEYSETASGTHLTEQGETYSGGSTSSYPSLGGYVGSTTSSIDITDYSRIPGGVGLSGSSIDSHVESTSPKYGQTNIHAGSSAFNADGYSSSTGIYSGVTGGRQPSFGQTGPSVSHPGATGNIEITGTTNRESTATAFRKSTDAGYSKATGGISSTESNVHQFTGSGVEFNPYSTTASGRVPGADFTYGVPKSELGTSGISTVSGHVGITSRPTGPSSTGYKYNEDGGYTVPVFIQHEEPIYPSAPTGTTGTLGVHLPTGKATFNFQDGRTNFARPNLNVSIYGNEIPTGYDNQKGTTGTIQTGSSIDGNIITGDSFSGNVFGHGNVPGAVSTPAINQGTIIAGKVQPGYVATSSGTPGYVIGDGVKTAAPDDRFTAQSVTPGYSYPKPTVGFGSASPGILYGTPSPGGPIQITYHGGAPATGSIPYSSTPSEGLIFTTPQDYKTDNTPETHFISYKTDKHTEKDIPDYRPTSAILPDSNVPGIAGGAFGPTFQGSTTAAPGYSPSKSAVFTPSGFTKTGPTRTGITTAVLGGGGSYSISPGERRPAYSPDNISEKAFEGDVAGYTSSNDGSSVTLIPPGYSSTPAPGGGISVQLPTSGYSYSRPTGQFGTSGAPFSSTPAPGGGISVQSPISGYSYPRPTGQFGTSAPFSSTPAPGGGISVQSPTSGYSYPRPTGQFGTSGAPFSSTAAPSGGISVQLPTSGYSYSRPTDQFGTSGAPFSSTAAPGGGISVQLPTSGNSYSRPTGQFGTSGVPFSSTAAPGGGISVQLPTSGYSYSRPTGQFGTSGSPFSSTPAPGGGISIQSPTSGYSYPRPTGQFGTSGVPFSSTPAPGDRVTVQPATSGYSYSKPTVQFGTSRAPFFSTSIGSNLPVTTPTPFFSRLPTSTVSPVIYTTEHPEIYQSTIFESKKIPGAIPTDKPISNTVYKISSPLIDDQFTQRTGGPQTATVSPTSFDLGLPFQKTDSSGQTGYGSSLGYLPAKSTPGVIASTTKYEGSTPRPDFIGVTYKKPSPIDVSYGGPSSFQTPTTYRPPNYYDQGFSTTPSSLETTPGGGSPTNLDISRHKIDQLITNYDRGTVKYTPPLHDTYPSSGFGSTRKFISSSTQSSFSTKFGSGFTTPSGIRPSTLSYEVTTKSSEGKGKVIVKWSDLHPLLLGKLGAECTCKADPFANIRGPAKQLIQSSKGKVDLANYDSSEIYVDLGSSEEGDYSTNSDNLPAQPFKISVPETSDSIKPPSSAYLPAIDGRISAKNNELRSGRRGKKLEYEEEVEEEEEKDEYNYDDDPDQIINGVSDCARPGLFRHPGLCNKFYACHWDQWKKKFTLHIFNCPVHLTFDSHAGACNWPSKGPACQADNLLV